MEIQATILPFPKRRGRPRRVREEKDLGTPELMRKRAEGETSEALDLCFARQLITNEEHWCGMHLRWLHTLRFGTNSIRAMDPARLKLGETAYDPHWLEAREREYQEAIAILRQSKCLALIMGLCIYNERPGPRQMGPIKEGLGLLEKLWRRRRTKK